MTSAESMLDLPCCLLLLWPVQLEPMPRGDLNTAEATGGRAALATIHRDEVCMASRGDTHTC